MLRENGHTEAYGSKQRYTIVRMNTEQAPSKTAKEEYIPSLRELLRIIWSRLWVIAAITILATGAAVGYNLLQTPEYEASITILVGQEEQEESDRPGDLAGQIQGLQQITQTMVEAVGSRPVAEAVIRQLNLDLSPENFLNQHLNVEQVGATQFVQVNYRDQNPQTAQQAANAVGDVFSERVSEVSPSANSITATVWERATVPEDPVSPNPMFTITLALMLGLMLGVGSAFLLEYLNDNWRSPEEAEQISGVPTFGVIPQFEAVTDSTKKGKQGTD